MVANSKDAIFESVSPIHLRTPVTAPRPERLQIGVGKDHYQTCQVVAVTGVCRIEVLARITVAVSVVVSAESVSLRAMEKLEISATGSGRVLSPQ
jgi:hypothetical protein